MTKTYTLKDKDNRQVEITIETTNSVSRIKTPERIKQEIANLDKYINDCQETKTKLQDELTEVNKLLTD